MNYQRNISKKRINHLDSEGRKLRKKGMGLERVEQVIVPRLSLGMINLDLVIETITMTTTATARRRERRRMIRSWLIGIQRMILRTHRIGMSPLSPLHDMS